MISSIANLVYEGSIVIELSDTFLFKKHNKNTTKENKNTTKHNKTQQITAKHNKSTKHKNSTKILMLFFKNQIKIAFYVCKRLCYFFFFKKPNKNKLLEV